MAGGGDPVDFSRRQRAAVADRFGRGRGGAEREHPLSQVGGTLDDRADIARAINIVQQLGIAGIAAGAFGGMANERVLEEHLVDRVPADFRNDKLAPLLGRQLAAERVEKRDERRHSLVHVASAAEIEQGFVQFLAHRFTRFTRSPKVRIFCTS
jgi:hypothetical protein